MYREHHHESEFDRDHFYDPQHGIHHPETYGKDHIFEDAFAKQYGDLQHDEDTYERKFDTVFVQPTVASMHHEFTVGEDQEPVGAHWSKVDDQSREVEYWMDEYGHIHTYEEEPEYLHAYLQ